MREQVVSCEKTCKTCGKTFIMHSEWVFYRNSGSRELVFCSWGCLRKWEKSHGSNTERRERIIQSIKDGLTNKEISALLDEDVSKIDYWRKRLKEEKNEGDLQEGS